MYCSKKKSKAERRAERLQRDNELKTELIKVYRELAKHLRQDADLAELVKVRPGKRG